MSSSDPRDALTDLISCLQNTFKRYDRSARTKAWRALQVGKGKEEVNRLLNSPGQQVTGIPGLLKFKEWLAANSD
jgi:hypothetical protein